MLQVENINSNTLLAEVAKLLKSELSKHAAPPQPSPDDFITRQDVADMFKITLVTVHAWINAGILTPYKIGNKTRFKRGEVLAAAKNIPNHKTNKSE